MTTQYFVCSHDGKWQYECSSKDHADAACAKLNMFWADDARRTWYVTETLPDSGTGLPNTNPVLRFIVFAAIAYAIVLGSALFF